MTDDTEFTFELGQAEDGKTWVLKVSADEKISEQEFAACLLSLAEDMLKGEVSLKNFPKKDDGKH